jgi:uncharacterized protein
MLRTSIFIFGLMICFGLKAQSIKLVARTDGNSVQLKWFTDKLLADEGVNLYRRSENGSWTKINSLPIRKGEYTPSASEFQSDPDLKKYMDLLRTTKPLESFGLLLATLQAVKSTPYARAAGLYYSEQKQSGVTGYKVALIVRGQEAAFAEYNFNEQAENEKLSGIEFEQKFKKVQFKWTVEENKFYAVNVYRSSSRDSLGVLVNKEPIIPSKVKDESGKSDYPKWFMEDRLVREKSTYYYSLVGIDFFNKEQERSEPIEIRIKDETAPIPPVLKSKAEKPNGFMLHWEHFEKSDDQAGYEIHLTHKNDSLFYPLSTLIASTQDSFLVELKAFGTYSVMVASKDVEGNLGFSNEMVLDYLDKIPPAKPVNVRLDTDSTVIRITWDNNAEADLLGYKIYRGINGDVKSMTLQNAAPFSQNVYVDRLPKNARNSFSYSVMAVDSSLNESPLSDIASKKLQDVVPPKAPFIKNIEAHEKAVLISWSKNTEADLLKYEVYRKNLSDSLSGFQQLNLTVLDRNASAFIDRNFQRGEEYIYVMYALDSVGNRSLMSNQFKYFMPKEKEVQNISCRLKEPKIVKATGAVKLGWEIKPYDESVKYMVFRKIQGGSFLPLSGLLEDTRYSDQTAVKDQVYIYEIRCYLSDGKVVKSEPKEIVIRNKEPKV